MKKLRIFGCESNEEAVELVRMLDRAFYTSKPIVYVDVFDAVNIELELPMNIEVELIKD